MVADLLEYLGLLGIGQEQYFQSCCQAANLHLAIEPALIAAYAVHDARNVVKFILDLREELHLGLVRRFVLEEVLFPEWLIAVTLRKPLQQALNQSLRIQVVLRPKACLVIVLDQWLFHHYDSFDDGPVDEVEVLDALGMIAHLLQEVCLVVGVAAFIFAFEPLADVGVDRGVEATHQVVQKGGLRARLRMVEQAELVLVDPQLEVREGLVKHAVLLVNRVPDRSTLISCVRL